MQQHACCPRTTSTCTISLDRATLERMTEVEFSEFKTKTKQPILVTRRGKPLVEVVPPSPEKRDVPGRMKGRGMAMKELVPPVGDLAPNRRGRGRHQRKKKSKTKAPPGARGSKKGFLGSMKGQIKILGDIVSPVIDLDDIEALRD